MTDDQIATLLRESTSGLEPDVLDLVAGGVTRGRQVRRRRRAGAALAAVAVGAAVVAVAVSPGVGGSESSDQGIVADQTQDKPKADPPKQDDGPARDAALAVAAADVPATIATMLPPGDVSPALDEGSFPLVNKPDNRIAHFRYQGTLTTFIIEPAAGMPTCQQQADEQSVTCSKVGGLDVLTYPPTEADQVTAQAISVWRHGYIVTALSYNAADGKDVAPLMDQPAISLEQLTQIATSDAWFSWTLKQ